MTSHVAREPELVLQLVLKKLIHPLFGPRVLSHLRLRGTMLKPSGSWSAAFSGLELVGY